MWQTRRQFLKTSYSVPSRGSPAPARNIIIAASNTSAQRTYGVAVRSVAVSISAAACERQYPSSSAAVAWPPAVNTSSLTKHWPPSCCAARDAAAAAAAAWCGKSRQFVSNSRRRSICFGLQSVSVIIHLLYTNTIIISHVYGLLSLYHVASSQPIFGPIKYLILPNLLYLTHCNAILNFLSCACANSLLHGPHRMHPINDASAFMLYFVDGILCGKSLIKIIEYVDVL